MNEKDVELYAQQRAEEYCVGNTDGEPYSEYEGHFYKAGFAAGRELGRLEGRIEVLREAANAVEDSCSYSEVAEEAAWRTVHLEEEKLAALLGTGKVE